MPGPKTRRPRSPKSSTGSILINFVLDKSGSMNNVVNDAIGGFNTYLRELKRDKGANYRFSLTLFDTEVESRYTNATLNVIPELTNNTYVPGGYTALLDAIGSTVAAVEQNASGMEKVLTVILTDGEENSSREYSLAQIKSLIEHKEKEGHWTFVFLGVGLDAFAAGDRIGVARPNSVAYDPAHMTAMFRNTAQATTCYAHSSDLRLDDFYKTVQKRRMAAASMSLREA
jgi:uncharacterized protein YegL